MDSIQGLLDRLKSDEVLRSEILGSPTIEAAIAVVNANGFALTKEQWLHHQAAQTLDLGDDELEKVAGGQVCDQTKNSLSACGDWESC